MTRRRLPTSWVVAASIIVGAAAILAACQDDQQILADDPSRTDVPAEATLVSESVDAGSGVIKDGEQTVLRVFEPVPPSTADDVADALVASGSGAGWEFGPVLDGNAVGTKSIDGRPWMVSVTIRDGTVTQLFAGR